MTLLQHETKVDVHGKNDAVIAHATRIFESGHFLGVSYPPEAVRAVLYDSDLFLPSEIDAWPSDVSVLVPLGKGSFDWIPETAAYEGYAYKAYYWRGALYSWPVNEEREYLEFVWARYGELVEGPVEITEQAKL